MTETANLRPFLRFDTDGRQIEMVMADTKPSADFYTAPANFNPSRIYQRTGGAISPVEENTLAAERLARLKREARLRVETMAEVARTRFVTPGAAKAMVYQRKLEEARGYAQNPEAPCPLLAAEATARGMELSAIAALVLSLADAWAEVAGQIEALTVSAIDAIKTAQTETEVLSALDVEWPEPA